MVRSLMESDEKPSTSGMPWYVTAFMWAGFPAAIATWLLWNQSVNVHAEHNEIKQAITEQSIQQKDYFVQQLYLNKLQCVFAAKNDGQRAQCEQVLYIKGAK